MRVSAQRLIFELRFHTALPNMGASESTLSSGKTPDDKITTITERSEASDPILERLKYLKITPPILTSPPTEGTLTDILVRKPSSSSVSATVNPKVILELFSIYHDWQEKKAQEISIRQEEIENKIEVADALAIKLLQRYNHSTSTMKTASQHLSGVHSLQVEIGELKGRLTEVISNCDALCKRIATEGPESLVSSIKPFAVTTANQETYSSSSSLRIVSKTNPPSAEE
ncbi:hypothetical protein GLYMA_01G167600v4 [Glycine max]|uniref:BLOC-1-related complex subunit 5 n=1 Tax=Glycine max TaxID=3847 RepID=I1J8M7_SOYBN|nr:uncharacterized protein LOC100778225 isoform X1 [Glycine max]KAH1163492.1 hypothetical protein GYH30_001828 [Glycine max]KAH1266904.1 hypothetical protein GmHk_01G002265 [Glycine max]KRH76675.1 hypothetical protein GLYMA_01G167600v4 [Glycine max]|eukprot:XP_003517185.1 uncharacterized protein LOC100778225 isoform X2 [Glycine max]